MELSTFFDKFALFADAPDALAKMRSLLTHFAVVGKLVPNNPAEKPVDLNLSTTSPDNFILPENWRSGLLSDVFVFEYGDNLPAPKRTESGEYPVYGSNGIVGTHDTYLIKEPAIIIGRKGSAGALNIAAGPSWTTDVAYFVRPPRDLDLRFTYYLFSTLNLADLGKGIKPGLSRKEAYALRITVPPLAEQKRIVAKVDELMALCDQLEAQQEERETRHASLSRASLSRFADAPTPANLNFLFHQSYAISPADLRKSILTLAVQGKLVPQDPNDEPADVFVATLLNAARESGYRGRSNSEDDSNPKFVTHVLGELPAGWSVCPLEDLFKFIDYRGRTPVRRSSGVRLITAKNVKKGFISNEPIEFIAEDVYPKWMTRGFPKKGDLLFVTEGHTMGFVGTLNFDFKYALAQRTIDLQPFCEGYGPFYLYYLLSEPFQTAVVSNTTGSAAQGIKAAKLKRIRVIIPPLAEQRRIVAKVDQLMALVDQLETQLATARSTVANLLEALVAELTVSPSKTLTSACTSAHKVKLSFAAETAALYGRDAEVIELSSSPEYIRAVFAAEIIHRLHQEATFGQTKFQKISYLAEYICEINEIDSHPARFPRGPYDPKLISQVETKMEQLEWFKETMRSDGHGHQYIALARAGAHKMDFEKLWPKKAAAIRRLIEEMRTWKTERCERFATLYAAWNDLIVWQAPATDTAILREVLENWHSEKIKIPRVNWEETLAWMHREGFVPKGFGRATRAAPQKELF